MAHFDVKRQLPELIQVLKLHLVPKLADAVLCIDEDDYIYDVDFYFDDSEDSFSSREFLFGSETRKNLDFIVELLQTLWESGSLFDVNLTY